MQRLMTFGDCVRGLIPEPGTRTTLLLYFFVGPTFPCLKCGYAESKSIPFCRNVTAAPVCFGAGCGTPFCYFALLARFDPEALFLANLQEPRTMRLSAPSPLLRDAERERERETHTHVCPHTHTQAGKSK